jgi:hypothetical protein
MGRQTDVTIIWSNPCCTKKVSGNINRFSKGTIILIMIIIMIKISNKSKQCYKKKRGYVCM